MSLINDSTNITVHPEKPKKLLNGSLILKNAYNKDNSWIDNFKKTVDKDTTTALTVAKDLGRGAITEVEEHPITLLKDAAIGAATTAAIVIVPELAVPAIMASAFAVGYHAKDIIKGAQSFGHDISIVNNSKSSLSERIKAKQDLKSDGTFLAQFTATMAGGAIGGIGAGLAKSAFSTDSSALASSDTIAQSSTEAKTINTADTTQPEDRALNDSITQNQNYFKEASDENRVIQAKKQLYNVKFTKITQEGKLPTLEHPSGEDIKPGQWIATRLDQNGHPVIENGQINQWPVTPKTILKAYQVNDDALNQDSFVAPTKVDGPNVTMMQITKNMVDPQTGKFEMRASWGPMSGKEGDWLANYDFNPETQLPGKDYAIITGQSFKQTYQIIPKA